MLSIWRTPALWRRPHLSFANSSPSIVSPSHPFGKISYPRCSYSFMLSMLSMFVWYFSFHVYEISLGNVWGESREEELIGHVVSSQQFAICFSVTHAFRHRIAFWHVFEVRSTQSIGMLQRTLRLVLLAATLAGISSSRAQGCHNSISAWNDFACCFVSVPALVDPSLPFGSCVMLSSKTTSVVVYPRRGRTAECSCN